MNYDDIIDHEHHVSKTHPQMSMLQRAAQFAPFAALTGYDAAISEQARQTETEMLCEHVEDHPEINSDDDI